MRVLPYYSLSTFLGCASISPNSTRCTTSVSAAWVGAGMPTSSPFVATSESEVHRLLVQALHLVQMQRLDAYGVLPLRAAQVNAIVLDIFDMLRPGIDERHILTNTCKMPTDVPPTAPAPIKTMRLLMILLRAVPAVSPHGAVDVPYL